MSKKWDTIADDQFRSMPSSFQEDWGELREIVQRHENDTN